MYKAELSMAIRGEKQEVSFVCLKIKNPITRESANEVSKLKNLAEDYRAVIYENEKDIIFILSPMKTKTLKNEK